MPFPEFVGVGDREGQMYCPLGLSKVHGRGVSHGFVLVGVGLVIKVLGLPPMMEMHT